MVMCSAPLFIYRFSANVGVAISARRWHLKDNRSKSVGDCLHRPQKHHCGFAAFPVFGGRGPGANPLPAHPPNHQIVYNIKLYFTLARYIICAQGSIDIGTIKYSCNTVI